MAPNSKKKKQPDHTRKRVNKCRLAVIPGVDNAEVAFKKGQEVWCMWRQRYYKAVVKEVRVKTTDTQYYHVHYWKFPTSMDATVDEKNLLAMNKENDKIVKIRNHEHTRAQKEKKNKDLARKSAEREVNEKKLVLSLTRTEPTEAQIKAYQRRLKNHESLVSDSENQVSASTSNYVPNKQGQNVQNQSPTFTDDEVLNRKEPQPKDIGLKAKDGNNKKSNKVLKRKEQQPKDTGTGLKAEDGNNEKKNEVPRKRWQTKKSNSLIADNYRNNVHQENERSNTLETNTIVIAESHQQNFIEHIDVEVANPETEEKLCLNNEHEDLADNIAVSESRCTVNQTLSTYEVTSQTENLHDERHNFEATLSEPEKQLESHNQDIINTRDNSEVDKSKSIIQNPLNIKENNQTETSNSIIQTTMTHLQSNLDNERPILNENNHFVEDITTFESEDHIRLNNLQDSNSTITDCSEGNKSCCVINRLLTMISDGPCRINSVSIVPEMSDIVKSVDSNERNTINDTNPSGSPSVIVTEALQSSEKNNTKRDDINGHKSNVAVKLENITELHTVSEGGVVDDCEVSSTSNSKESNQTRNVSVILTTTTLPDTESNLNNNKKKTIDGDTIKKKKSNVSIKLENVENPTIFVPKEKFSGIIQSDLPSSSSDISTFNIDYGIACSSKTNTVVYDTSEFNEFEVDTTKGELSSANNKETNSPEISSDNEDNIKTTDGNDHVANTILKENMLNSQIITLDPECVVVDNEGNDQVDKANLPGLCDDMSEDLGGLENTDTYNDSQPSDETGAKKKETISTASIFDNENNSEIIDDENDCDLTRDKSINIYTTEAENLTNNGNNQIANLPEKNKDGSQDLCNFDSAVTMLALQQSGDDTSAKTKEITSQAISLDNENNSEITDDFLDNDQVEKLDLPEKHTNKSKNLGSFETAETVNGSQQDLKSSSDSLNKIHLSEELSSPSKASITRKRRISDYEYKTSNEEAIHNKKVKLSSNIENEVDDHTDQIDIAVHTNIMETVETSSKSEFSSGSFNKKSELGAIITDDLESDEVSSLNSYNLSEVGSISSTNVFPNSNNNKECEECCNNDFGFDVSSLNSKDSFEIEGPSTLTTYISSIKNHNNHDSCVDGDKFTKEKVHTNHMEKNTEDLDNYLVQEDTIVPSGEDTIVEPALESNDISSINNNSSYKIPNAFSPTTTLSFNLNNTTDHENSSIDGNNVAREKKHLKLKKKKPENNLVDKQDIVFSSPAPKINHNTNDDNGPTVSASTSTVPISNNRMESDYENDGQTTDDDNQYVKNRKVTKKKVKPSEEDINIFELFGFEKTYSRAAKVKATEAISQMSKPPVVKEKKNDSAKRSKNDKKKDEDEPWDTSSKLADYNLVIPNYVRKILIEDKHLILDDRFIAVLPASVTVHTILYHYSIKHSESKDTTEILLNAFNQVLPFWLLHTIEKPKYREIKKRYPNELMSNIYGLPHLLRFIVNLPKLFSIYKKIGPEFIPIIVRYVDGLFTYLVHEDLTLSLTDYDCVMPDQYRTGHYC